MSLGLTEVKQGKFIEFIPPDKGHFRQTCKSQSINPIAPTPKFNLGIIQITIKSISTIIVLIYSLIKQNIRICKISIVHLQPDSEVRGVCKVKVFFASVFPFNLICNMTTFRKKLTV